MKKTIFLTAITALLISAASCGQSAQKQKSAELSEEPQQEAVQEVVPAMPDEQFAALIQEIFYNLPESLIPSDLKTEKQRKAKVNRTIADSDSDNTQFINCLSHIIYYDGGGLDEWSMSGYLMADRQDVVVIVYSRVCFEGLCETSFYKTLNYNIEAKKFTEITCPVEPPFTTEELFEEMNFSNADMKNKAKEFFNGNKEIFYQFDRNGFSASADLSMFWFNGPEGAFDYYNEHFNEIYPDERKPASRKWNGSQFIKN